VSSNNLTLIIHAGQEIKNTKKKLGKNLVIWNAALQFLFFFRVLSAYELFSWDNWIYMSIQD
jgi:hypothetical protein